jgi:putative ABC transport system ATP-binding protein
VLIAALRDLQWRRQRFIIAIVGTGVVFAATLVLTGLANGSAGSLAILVGPSGCGKTTLLSCLGPILRPTSGAIKFGDGDVTALSARELSMHRHRTVGIVFQSFNLVPSLTARENVMVPMRAAGMSRPAAHQRAGELLTRVGLRDRMSHRPGD